MPRMDEEAWISKKNGILKDGLRLIDGFPVFSVAEFTLIAACTRKCPFCQASDPDYYRTQYAGVQPRYLTLRLYDKVLGDLAEIGYAGEIVYSGFGEPLLHPRWDKLLARTRNVLPEAKIMMITNGDLLSEDTLRVLFDQGLDELVISLYDGPEQVQIFETMRRRAGLSSERVILRRKYWNGQDYGIILTNRGGLVDVTRFCRPALDLPRARRCYYPFSFVKIDLNGDVLFCPHNWAKHSVLGDVAEDHLWDLWRGEKIEHIRERLYLGDRNIPSCARCDADGLRNGEESFRAWEKIRSTSGSSGAPRSG